MDASLKVSQLNFSKAFLRNTGDTTHFATAKINRGQFGALQTQTSDYYMFKLAPNHAREVNWGIGLNNNAIIAAFTRFGH